MKWYSTHNKSMNLKQGSRTCTRNSSLFLTCGITISQFFDSSGNIREEKEGIVICDSKGESDIPFKKTFCPMNICPQDFLPQEPTLWFRRTIFLRPQSPTKYLEGVFTIIIIFSPYCWLSYDKLFYLSWKVLFDLEAPLGCI